MIFTENTDKEVGKIGWFRMKMDEVPSMSKEWLEYADKIHKWEEIIKEKVWPHIQKAINAKDFDRAKQIAAGAYQGTQAAGLVLLFRSIIIEENKHKPLAEQEYIDYKGYYMRPKELNGVFGVSVYFSGKWEGPMSGFDTKEEALMAAKERVDRYAANGITFE